MQHAISKRDSRDLVRFAILSLALLALAILI